MKSIELYFVRHGQTVFNKYNRMQGWSDSPLTDQGYEDATNAGKRLSDVKFDAVYSSDTTRAINTAHSIMKENHNSIPKLTIAKEFREEFYGYFEGADSAQTWYLALMPISGQKTFHDFLEDHPIAASKDAMKAADPFNDAENDAEFWHRLNKGFANVLEAAKDGDKILIVSHGTTIRSIAGKIDPQLDITWGPQNGSITRVLMQDKNLSLDFYNNHSDDKLN
ncbi:histidine phosphatase family protein [Pediococcus claussenii]|uniref:Histidine phosphatase super family protein n=1 Tax=Pediococcus claussenii (strain ATCC BAA-344 / DSM 14800 / JCM 18046 / KCTC 3811 / LMG 21948 / P06) TaxID=701521 RepID=G8PEH8_PEDCP|nr:histidine phosphatase family protein [Pediococcus claussenii]AEV95587.1 histidine phosphatase super family protein [Pediococcus claussenii ATCC BAA-344]ANZ69108.1 fructose-2,6-bisphosphatase [Pediococcus claussenii]ANZ70925.1 fructose-2,6-bisphosphatase [Pediococcus claussenii]KRN20180.1 hypothetical protein IV79_GL000846 [Pediococcus claussenii]